MDNNIIIPKKVAIKNARTGGGSDYWDGFWKNYDNSEEFSSRINMVKSSLAPILQLDVDRNKEIYAQVKLDEKASAKSMQPTELWNQSSLDVVESRDTQTITISGTKADFQKLNSFLTRSDFNKAKDGSEDITRIEKNLFRECFAMTAVLNKNTDISSRVDAAVAEFIAQGDTALEIECIIEIYSNKRKTLYDNLYTELIEKLGDQSVKKRDERFFFYNMSFNCKLTAEQIKTLLSEIEFNFIRLIRAVPTFTAERSIPDANISSVRLLNPETDEIVGIIDSGIHNSVINSAKFQHENFLITGEREDKNHGTFVASRILFGDDIFTQVQGGSIKPCAKYLDIQVLHLSSAGDTQVRNIDVLEKAIHEAVERYPDVKIYNLSIAENKGVEDAQIEELTQFLDHIAREKDILFVCSVGNHHCYMGAHNYNEIFSETGFDNRVASPADALNVITVGSIAKSINSSCWCTDQSFPSPFTRRGGIRGGWKKPELVASGGNKTKDASGLYSSTEYNLACVNTVGVEGIDSVKLAKDIGTSFSAPLITRQAIYLLEYINKSNIEELLNLTGNRSNLVKSLLVHSTASSEQAAIASEDVKKAYGFGEPNYSKILKGSEDEVSIVYADSITYSEKLHRVRFKLPDFTSDGPVELIFTMVYNPPVNRNFSEYSMIKLTSTLKTIRPIINEETGKPDEVGIYLKPREWSWDNYKNDTFNTLHYRVSKKKLNFPYMEVLTQMYVSGNYESEFRGREVESIFQPYTFVLTIKDINKGNRLRSEMMATNQFETLVENRLEIQTS